MSTNEDQHPTVAPAGESDSEAKPPPSDALPEDSSRKAEDGRPELVAVPGSGTEADGLTAGANGAGGQTPSLTPAPPPVDVAGELAAWALALPAWQRHLVAKLLVKETLTDAERRECASLVHEAAGGPSAGVTPLPLARHDFPDPVPATDTPKLVGLGPLRNVNAVADGARLRFEPDGLTIVFGMNAAGKSSYVRPLKRLCRSVHREGDILPNVFAPVRSSSAPAAQVETRVAPVAGTLAKEYKLSVGEESPLSSMSVFDAGCANVYVSSENEVAFTPSLLGLLDRLAHEQTAIKDLVDGDRNSLVSKRVALPDLPATSSATAFVAQLASTTTATEIEAATRPLDETEVLRRDELQLVVAPAAQEERRRRRSTLDAEAAAADDLIRRLDALATALNADAEHELKTLQAQAATARHSAQLAAHEAFEITALSGVGSSPWQGLWETARRFYEAEVNPEAAFPPVAEGDNCPLCFQELSPEARTRFTRFEEYVKSTAEADARSAEAAVAAAQQKLNPEVVDRCRTPLFESLEQGDAEGHTKLATWLDEARIRLHGLRGEDPTAALIEASPTATGSSSSMGDGHEPTPELGPCPHEFIRQFAQARRAEVATIDSAAEPSELAKFTRELDELRGRDILAGHGKQVRARAKSIKEEAILTNACTRLSTRAISNKQRELSERVVTQALAARLRRELDGLNLGHVSIDLNQRARSGAMLLKLRLSASAAHPPDDILSEGERRALALAFFLAEIGEPGHDGGAVFDDPVSSLDHERKDAIAARIAQEATRRQVIVFTHDLSFLVRLRYHAEQAAVPLGCQTVWRSGDLVGRTTDDFPFEAMKVKQRISALADELQNLKPAEFVSPDDYQRAISTWYERLRRTWERLVEEVILAGVVERFSPAVHTNQLKDVRWSDEIVESVDRGMTRASTWVHDQPTAENATLPGKQDMARDLDEIRNLLKELREKR